MNKIIEFEKTIGSGESNSFYLNLTDNSGIKYGNKFPQDKTPLWIITGTNQYLASKKGDNQIWGVLRKWYDGESVKIGDVIKIRYDILSPAIEGRIPIYIDIINRCTIVPELPALDNENEDTVNQQVYETEINLKMEYDLENFLVDNLNLIESGLKIYKDANGRNGRQYYTEVGNIDLLCKKGNDYVVIELKKRRESDKVVGQISRYMGWIKSNIAKDNNVRGIIIVHEFDPKLKYAVIANPNIELKYYEIKIDFINEEKVKSKTYN